MNDDLDEDIIESDDFDEFAQGEGLGDSVRQSPVAKIGIALVAVAVIAGVVMMFGGEAVEDSKSVIPGGSDITSVPGTDEEVAPAYIEAVEQQNEADLERAMVEGGSSIPVPIETHDTRLEVPEVEEESEDPLHRWRLLQEERVEREMRTKEAEVEPVTVLNAEQQSEAIKGLAESMVEQMDSVLTANSADVTFHNVTLTAYTEEEEGAAGAGGVPGGAGGDDNFAEDDSEIVVIPAGKIVYGQMLLEANSDVPEVVLAQMVSGPLKGWKLLGEFTAEEDIEMLRIEFEIAVNEEGKQYELDAVMLDPDTGLAALATEVDHRYLRRIVLPAAASFIEGFAEALSETGQTTVTVDGGAAVSDTQEKDKDQEVATGVVEAAQDVGEILDDMGDVPVRIIIEAGTPIGVFFTENVVDDESNDI